MIHDMWPTKVLVKDVDLTDEELAEMNVAIEAIFASHQALSGDHKISGEDSMPLFTEENCKRLKNAKVLYDMGMKVAAVSVMCQDENVFDAMMQAGTPCPYDGQIGEAAKLGWETHEEKIREETGGGNLKQSAKDAAPFAGLGILAFLLFL